MRPEFDQTRAYINSDIDVRVRSLKSMQPRHEPRPAEKGFGAYAYDAIPWPFLDIAQRRVDRIEGVRQPVKQFSSRVG